MSFTLSKSYLTYLRCKYFGCSRLFGNFFRQINRLVENNLAFRKLNVDNDDSISKFDFENYHISIEQLFYILIPCHPTWPKWLKGWDLKKKYVVRVPIPSLFSFNFKQLFFNFYLFQLTLIWKIIFKKCFECDIVIELEFYL